MAQRTFKYTTLHLETDFRAVLFFARNGGGDLLLYFLRYILQVTSITVLFWPNFTGTNQPLSFPNMGEVQNVHKANLIEKSKLVCEVMTMVTSLATNYISVMRAKRWYSLQILY